MDEPNPQPIEADPRQQDPLDKALERLRHLDDFRLLIRDVRAQREDRFKDLEATTDANRQQQLVGAISALQQIADFFEGV